MGIRSENKENCLNVIRQYIDNHKKNKTEIESLRQIYLNIKALESENKLEFDISDKTFYRYAKEMNLKETASGSKQFDFIVDRPANFRSMLLPRKFNHFLCYELVDKYVAYGSLIVECLNDYYADGYQESFHCVLLGDMIVCFYYSQKADSESPKTSSETKDMSSEAKDTSSKVKDTSSKKNAIRSLSRKEILKDIRNCLKSYSITVTE